MKIIFLLTSNKNLNTRLADGTVLSQILAQTLPYATDGSVFVTAGNLPDDSILAFAENSARLEVPADIGNLGALRACRENGHIPDGPFLVVLDGTIVIAKYDKIESQTSAKIVSLMNRAFWFRSSMALNKVLDWESDQDLDTETIRPDKMISVGDVDELVQANRRLLGIGYSSKNALERSYTEEFGVIPPIFLHEEAEIYSSMIGPYVSIGAGALVQNCVLENCIVDDGAKISNLNLRDSIIGRDQEIIGTPQTIIKM